MTYSAINRKLSRLILIAPTIAFFGAGVLWPVCQSIWISFHSWDGSFLESGQMNAIWVGVGNYVDLVSDDAFRTSVLNNCIWLVFYLATVPIGLLVALLLNQFTPEMKVVKPLFLMPFVLAQALVGLIFVWVLEPKFGPMATVWGVFSREAPSVLADPTTATFGVISAGLWTQIAYCTLIYQAGITTLSKTQIEAARLDNAKGITMLRHIIIPQLRTATFVAVILSVIGALRSFDLVAVMTNGGPFGSTRILSFYMFETALSEYGVRKGYGASIAAVLFLSILVVTTPMLRRIFIDDRAAR